PRALVKQALKVPEKPQASASYQVLGDSPATEQVRMMIDRPSKSPAPVFINGESGSGKQLAARMIPPKGPRAELPCIAVNGGAILAKLSRGNGAALEPESVIALERYPFPGNVRELENILERGLSLAADPLHITAEDLHLTPVAEEHEAGSMPAGDKWPLQDY